MMILCVIGHSKIMRKFIYNINEIRHDYLSNQNIWSFKYNPSYKNDRNY